MACGPKTIEKSIENIDSAIENNNFSVATIELKSAIRSNPKNSHLRLKLGLLYLSQNKLTGAEKELFKAKELGEDVSKWLLPVVEVNYLLSHSERIINLWDDYKDSLNKSNKLNLDFYYALALINQNKDILGLEILNQVNNEAKAQSNEEISLLSQSLLLFLQNGSSQSNIKYGLKLLKQATIKHPNSKVAWLLYSKASSSNHNYNEAIFSSKKLIKILPGYLIAEITLIESFIALHDYPSAFKALDLTLKSHPEHPYIWQLYSKASLLSQKYEQANDAINKVIAKGLDNDETKIISGLAAFQLKNYEYSYTRLKSVSQNFSTDHPVNSVLLALEFKLNKEIKENRFKGSNGALVIQATDTLLSKQDSSQARSIIENFKLTDVTSPKIALTIGRLKLALGDTEDLENFSSLIDKVIGSNNLTKQEKHNVRELEIATLIKNNKLDAAQKKLS